MTFNTPVLYGILSILFMLGVLTWGLKASLTDLDLLCREDRLNKVTSAAIKRIIGRGALLGVILVLVFNGWRVPLKPVDVGAENTAQEVTEYMASPDYESPEVTNEKNENKKEREESRQQEEIKKAQRKAEKDFADFIKE